METVIYFKTKTCGPCRQITPAVERYPHIRIVDAMDNQELAKQYGIRSVPTLLVMTNGIETSRLVGTNQIFGYLHERKDQITN